MASAAVAHAAHSAGASNKAVRNDREQMVLGDGVNPIAAYSQSLADNNVRLIKVDDETPVWAQSQSDPQAQAVLPSRAARPNDVNGESTRYDHVKSRIKSKVMRNNPASDNTHGLQLDLGPGFGVSMLDGQEQDDSEDAYTSMPNSASKARANGLAYGTGSDLGTPDLTQSESRPSLSSASTTETSNSKSNALVHGLVDSEGDAKGKTRDHDFGSQDPPSDPSYDHKSQLQLDTKEADSSKQRDRLALSDLPSPVSSSSSGAPIETRPHKGSRDDLTVNTAKAVPSSAAAPAAPAAGDSISAVVIPPTPPTTTSATGSPTSDYYTPVKTSPRPSNTSLLAPGPLQKQQQQQSPGKQRSPALHTRSLSYQNATASTSSSSPSLFASTGSFPVRRSSLFPPSSPSAYTSALPESSSSAGLRNKRGSLSPQPKRTLSFRGAFSPGSSSHPLQQEVFYDEPVSLEQQAERQRQTEELEDSIARQAEQIRKERASKRQDAERAQVKAALLQHQQQQNQPPLAPLRIDTSGSVPKESKGKERERDNNRLEINIPQPASSSGKPLPNIQQEIDKQASPVTPTSPTGYLWNSPIAGENALVRSPVEGHFPSPTTAHAQLSTSQGPGARQGSAPVLVGNLIGEDHVNYILMYNMLTGIRIGVSRCEAKIQRPLTDEDYKAAHKFSFDIVGNELTPSARYDFKFKDYAPWVFRELRQWFHLDPADYLLSLTAKYILSELGSPGKSGSFFYFSRDYRFIIKTISHTEHKFLRKILKNYHQHVIDNPHTLISRFYGLHRVKLPRGRKIHFVIMNNLFPPHRDIHETFDLKGSSIGREYPEEKAKEKPRATLKDLNWIHRGRQLEVGPQKKQLFEDQLKRDVLFLQAMHIMDYSLLVGIHDLRRGNSENLRDGLLTVFQPEQGKLRRRPTIRGDLERQHEASELRKAVQRSDPKALRNSKLPDKDRSERRHFVFYQDEGGMRATNEWDKDENTIYYLGIIDILTPYNLYKRTEHFFRSFKYDQHRISAVPPEEYGNRFLDFLCSIVRGGDVSRRPKME